MSVYLQGKNQCWLLFLHLCEWYTVLPSHTQTQSFTVLLHYHTWGFFCFVENYHQLFSTLLSLSSN